MDRLILVFTRADGGVSVVTPIKQREKETVGQFKARIASRAIPQGSTNVHWTTEDKILSDRTFRNAWVQNGSEPPTVDMVKAREVLRENIRADRKAHFETNDLAILDSLVSGDAAAKATAITRRDKLRNATADPAIELSQTPEDLKLVRPF